jgi:hypothetical protein
MEDERQVTRGDFVRIGLGRRRRRSRDAAVSPSGTCATSSTGSATTATGTRTRDVGSRGSRYMCCGHAFILMGDASNRFFADRSVGLLEQFPAIKYFLIFLIAHFHKAALLMLSDRLVEALNRLDIEDVESVRRFKRSFRA